MAGILQWPDPILSTASTFLDLQNIAEIRQLGRNLTSTYHQLRGHKIGLAAPQIGINKSMAIVMGMLMMNLEFEPVKQMDFYQEGCFSIENATKFFNVMRPKYGYAKWVDPYTLEAHDEKLVGLKARVFQHELDHLNGKLCHDATISEAVTDLV